MLTALRINTSNDLLDFLQENKADASYGADGSISIDLASLSSGNHPFDLFASQPNAVNAVDDWSKHLPGDHGLLLDLCQRRSGLVFRQPDAQRLGCTATAKAFSPPDGHWWVNTLSAYLMAACGGHCASQVANTLAGFYPTLVVNVALHLGLDPLLFRRQLTFRESPGYIIPEGEWPKDLTASNILAALRDLTGHQLTT